MEAPAPMPAAKKRRRRKYESRSRPERNRLSLELRAHSRSHTADSCFHAPQETNRIGHYLYGRHAGEWRLLRLYFADPSATDRDRARYRPESIVATGVPGHQRRP